MKVQVGKLESLMEKGNPIETLTKLTESGFVALLPGVTVSHEFVSEFLKVPDNVSKKVIILDENNGSSLIDAILYRIDDYRELMDWSTRLYGDARVRLIEKAVYHGHPTFQILLARIYENGVYGVEVDYEKALEWLNAVMYEDGLAVDGAIERLEEKIKRQGQK